MQSKKGVTWLEKTVIFLILNVVFFAALFIFVARAGTELEVKEQIYAKQFALMIDRAKLGTTLSLNLTELYDLAEKNKYNGRVVDLNVNDGSITVMLQSGKGYTQDFFTNLKSGDVSEENKILKIRVG